MEHQVPLLDDRDMKLIKAAYALVYSRVISEAQCLLRGAMGSHHPRAERPEEPSSPCTRNQLTIQVLS